MKNTVVALIFTGVFAASSAFAAQPITGAFGYSLGTPVDTTNMHTDGSNIPDQPGVTTNDSVSTNLQVYKADPLDNDKNFDEYTLVINSQNNVATITANKAFSNQGECITKLKGMATNFVQQYGNAIVNEKSSFYLMDQMVPTRSLSLNCSSGVMIFIANDTAIKSEKN